MNSTAKAFVYNIPTIILSIGTLYMAINHIEGWGWVLFAAILLYMTPKDIRKEQQNNN